ncbi:MAG: hypothetical protein RIF32_09355 [Leptospirales bacterium]|jgi:hypothetical protein
MPPPPTITFTIEYRDLAACKADVVVLKYARRFRGKERVIRDALIGRGIPEEAITPGDGEYRLVETRSGIAAEVALFVGTVPIGLSHYRTIREFTVRSLAIVKEQLPATRHVAMTIHGAGRGLDETECARAQVRGIMLAIQLGTIPPELERITICEISRKRALRVQDRLADYLNLSAFATRAERGWGYKIQCPDRNCDPPDERFEANGDDGEEKPYAFIAMPFREELDDIYFYGIQNPVHNNGLLCERVDQSAFIGDVLAHIKTRIKNAKVLIAELSDASPNVYLEVGYAWGRGVPTILLTKSGEVLKFDVRNERCLVYKRIKDLEEILARELEALRESGRI